MPAGADAPAPVSKDAQIVLFYFLHLCYKLPDSRERQYKSWAFKRRFGAKVVACRLALTLPRVTAIKLYKFYHTTLSFSLTHTHTITHSHTHSLSLSLSLSLAHTHTHTHSHSQSKSHRW